MTDHDQLADMVSWLCDMMGGLADDAYDGVNNTLTLQESELSALADLVMEICLRTDALAGRLPASVLADINAQPLEMPSVPAGPMKHLSAADLRLMEY